MLNLTMYCYPDMREKFIIFAWVVQHEAKIYHKLKVSVSSFYNVDKSVFI